MRNCIEFLEKIHSNLRGSLSPIHWKKLYCITFYDDIIETYHIQTMWHKSPAFEKLLEFNSWAKNQSEKMFKRYQTDRKGQFDNKTLKMGR